MYLGKTQAFYVYTLQSLQSQISLVTGGLLRKIPLSASLKLPKPVQMLSSSKVLMTLPCQQSFMYERVRKVSRRRSSEWLSGQTSGVRCHWDLVLDVRFAKSVIECTISCRKYYLSYYHLVVGLPSHEYPIVYILSLKCNL